MGAVDAMAMVWLADPRGPVSRLARAVTSLLNGSRALKKDHGPRDEVAVLER